MSNRWSHVILSESAVFQLNAFAHQFIPFISEKDHTKCLYHCLATPNLNDVWISYASWYHEHYLIYIFMYDFDFLIFVCVHNVLLGHPQPYSFETWLLTEPRASLASSKHQPVSCLSLTWCLGYRCVQGHTSLFAWVLGIQTRVFMFVKKALLPTEQQSKHL